MKLLLVLLAALLAFAAGAEELEVDSHYNGACCTQSGSCHDVTGIMCHIYGGHFFGKDTTCEMYEGMCPGACCSVDQCTWAFENECEGLYRGNATTCDYDCDGACCTDGSCERMLESGCMEGKFHGIGTHCLPEGQCPQTDWIGAMALLFAVLFFLTAFAVLVFVCRRNRP